MSDDEVLECETLVVATGGLSLPKLGATDFGYRIARQFGLGITELRPGLVPLTFQPNEQPLTALAGVSLPVVRAASWWCVQGSDARDAPWCEWSRDSSSVELLAGW
jgi:predicted flavoprotein YhiN